MSRLIPVPKGMCSAFYRFMGAGCPRSESGEILMIGPVGDYRDIYVAACGRDFPTRREGVEHERECPACQGDIEIIATCEACGEKILEGDTYGVTTDGCYLHTGCAEGLEE